MKKIKKITATILSFAMVLSYPLNGIAAVDLNDGKSQLEEYWKNENFDLSNMESEWWYNAWMISTNAYNLIQDNFNWEAPNSKQAYNSCMVELLVGDSQEMEYTWDAANGAYDFLGVRSGVFELFEGAESIGNYQIGVTDAIGAIPDQVIFVSKNIWTLAKLLSGSEEKLKGIEVLAQNGKGKVKSAAKKTVSQRENILEDGIAATLMKDIISEKGIKQVASCTFEGLFQVYSAAVNTLTYGLNKTMKIGDITESATQYQTYMYIQDDIEACLKELKRSKYDSDEAYLADYRALTYLYVACSYKGMMVFNDTIMEDHEAQRKKVSEVYEKTLLEILKVGQESVPAQSQNSENIQSDPVVMSAVGDSVPYGYLDQAEGGKDTIYVRGWAYDPDTPRSSLLIHIYVDQQFAKEIRADVQREDVNVIMGCGAYHGFETTFSYPVSSTGSHEVAVYALNTNSYGSNQVLQGGYRYITIWE